MTSPLDIIARFDATLGRWQLVGHVSSARGSPQVADLHDGRFAIAGGGDTTGPLILLSLSVLPSGQRGRGRW